MKQYLMFTIVMGLSALAVAEGTAWRVSAGGRMRFGIDSSLRLNGRAAVPLLAPQVGSTKDAEEAKTSLGNLASGGRMEFSDGSFIAKDEADGSKTWNWQMTDLQNHLSADGSTLEFRSETFAVGDPVINETPLRDGVSDECTSGVSVELARTLWQNDRWGVDVSLGFSWFDEVNILKSSGRVLSHSAVTGYYQTDVIMSPALQGEISPTTTMLGDATFVGPGPTITLPTTGPALMTSATTSRLWINANGKMSMLESQLALEPFVRVWDQLYLRGKVGVAMIATDISIQGAIHEVGRGAVWSGSEDTHDISFAAILGLSAAYYFTDNFFVQGGVEMLVGADDVNVIVLAIVKVTFYRAHIDNLASNRLKSHN